MPDDTVKITLRELFPVAAPLPEHAIDRLKLASFDLRRGIELAAERGDDEAQSVLAHEAQQTLARWAPPPRRRKQRSPPDDSPGRISAATAAARLGVSLRKLQHMAASGELPGAALIGRRWSLDPDALTQYIAQQEALRWPNGTSTGAARSGGAASRPPAASTAAAYRQAIALKPRAVSRHGRSS